MTDTSTTQSVETRHRELAIEHILFGTIKRLAASDPGLLGELEASVDHLWDHAADETRDDEAVRAVARRFIKSLRDTAAWN